MDNVNLFSVIGDQTGAWMEETDVWATLTEHNSVIFHDNDFEVFIDTDGSNHNYKEFEINALGTTWSLLLNKPYSDDGGENSKRVDPIHGFDMEPELQSAVKVYPNHSINDPDVRNTHWTVEIAFPIQKLLHKAHQLHPGTSNHATFWRINFSRVQWGVRIEEDNAAADMSANTTKKYVKEPCCQSCETPGASKEDNWAWSRQHEINMHLPERWGILQFSTESAAGAAPAKHQDQLYYEEWPCRCAAMALYYALKQYHDQNGKYTDDVSILKSYGIPLFPLCDEAELTVVWNKEGFEATAILGERTAIVNEERYLRVIEKVSYD